MVIIEFQMKITPVIIVKDASKTIGQTLESLKFFHEVIVYDTGSLDNTLEIAIIYKNVKIHKGTFVRFGESKNNAAQLANNNWILSIDADEVVSPKLLESILKIELNESIAYRFKRTNYYRNQKIKYSGWGNEYVIRLYNRTKLGFNERLVHEKIDPGNAEIITIKGELMHYSYHSISEFIIKRDLYSELFALENCGKRKSSPFFAFVSGTFDFLNTFLIKKSFLDGYRGLLIAVSNANVSFYKYLKLYEANLNNNKKISLIIRACNSAEWLLASLKSVLLQTVTPSEIVVCYDSSNAGITETIEQFNQYSFLPVVQLPQKIDDLKSDNWIKTAIEKAHFDYYIVMNDHLVLKPDFVFKHSKSAQKSFIVEEKISILNTKLTQNILKDLNLKVPFTTIAGFRLLIKSFLQVFFPNYYQDNGCKNFTNLSSGAISFFKDDILNAIENSDLNSDKIQLHNNLSIKKRNFEFLVQAYQLTDNIKSKNMEKQKVLVCLDRLKYLNCGLGQVSLNLGRKIIESGSENIEYNFMVPTSGFPEFESKISTLKLNIWRSVFSIFMKKYDLCHVTHQLPAYNFGSAKKNLITIHDLNFLYTKSQRKINGYLRKIQKNILKCDGIVFISEFTKQTCYQYLNIPDDKIVRVIYNGVEKPGLQTEKPAWLPAKNFLFSIGQFLDKKNFHVLIPFIKKLPENIILVIAGENNTNYGKKMQQLIAENNLENRILLPGGVSEIQKNYLYHNCTAFLFPSIAEGFGLPVIEAMLCNKPVFCSDRTSLKEIGNEFAFFWKDFEPENMLEIFNYGMQNFRKNNFLERQNEYASSFTYERNVKEYLQLYDELISK